MSKSPGSVAWLWVKKILLNSEWLNVPCFHVRRERKSANSPLLCRYISFVFNTYSSSILLSILPFGLVACTCVLFSENVSRNSSVSLCLIEHSVYFFGREICLQEFYPMFVVKSDAHWVSLLFFSFVIANFDLNRNKRKDRIRRNKQSKPPAPWEFYFNTPKFFIMNCILKEALDTINIK